MSDAGVTALAGLGQGLLDWVGAMNLATGVVLAAVLLVDRLLERRVAASLRLCLYAAVGGRLLLPAGWQSPLGLLGGTPAPALAPAEGAFSTASFAASEAGPPMLGVPGWAAILYVAVALVLLGRWAQTRVALRGRLRGTVPLGVWGKRIPVSFHPELGPLVAGLVRPRIVVPATLVGRASAEALAWVLRHETAHIHRRDPWLGAGVQIACILAWPVLPVWIAARRVRTLMEIACDERAVAGADGRARRRYGEVLLALAEGALPHRTLGPVLAFGSPLRGRLRALAARRRWPKAAQAAIVVTTASLVIACAGEPEPALPPADFGDASLVDHAQDSGEEAPSTIASSKGTGFSSSSSSSKKAGPVLEIGKNTDLLLAARRIPPERLEEELRTAPTSSLSKGLSQNSRATQQPRNPAIMPGQASVRGQLDKDIIRRTIRRHIDEVKACYEAGLARRRSSFSGRVAVQFTIARTGDVVASMLQSSTLQAPRVESCIVGAIRNWKFPKPQGGGIVIVTYPFNFTPAGSN